MSISIESIASNLVVTRARPSSARNRFCPYILAAGRMLPLLVLLAFALHTPPAQAQASTRQVTLPNQDYTESTEDLVVKVLGGRIVIDRTWTWGKWYLNGAWADLILQPDPLGGVLALNRADRIYTRVGGSGGGSGTPATYTFDENNLIKSILGGDGKVAGWQWYDREGNTISYDAAGRMQGHANPAGVKVTLVRNAEGHITAIQDHQGQIVVTIGYAAGLHIQVTDASAGGTGRSVRYEWSGSSGISATTRARRGIRRPRRKSPSRTIWSTSAASRRPSRHWATQHGRCLHSGFRTCIRRPVSALLGGRRR
jgi:YD repeat-containing protein